MSTRTATLFPYTTLFRSGDRHLRRMAAATQADLSRFVQCRPQHGWRGAKELDSVGAQVFKRVDPLARLGWCGKCLDPVAHGREIRVDNQVGGRDRKSTRLNSSH